MRTTQNVSLPSDGQDNDFSLSVLSHGVQVFFNALLAMLNARPSVTKDSVIEVYQLHQSVGVDSTISHNNSKRRIHIERRRLDIESNAKVSNEILDKHRLYD